MGNSMSAFTEKRAHPRIDVCGKVHFKGESMEEFEQGELRNVSQTGILLWTQSQFELGDMLSIMIEPDEPGSAPIEMKAKIVRNHLGKDNERLGYGCLIIEKTGID